VKTIWLPYAARPCSTSIPYAGVPISPVRRSGGRSDRWNDRVTTAIGLGGQAKGHVPSKTPRAAALLGVLILVSVAVNGLIVVADGSLRQPASTVELAR
jgi:hypothetical protein